MNRRFWADVWTVVRKEWLEWISAPACLLQPVVIIAVFGALVPLALGRLWLGSPAVHWLWSWLPLMLSAGMVADTFAGERERDTLEALLASRLSDRAIIVGKVAAVAAYGWSITLFCWLLGWASLWFAQGGVVGSIPSEQLVALPLFSFLAAWYVACVGVLISLRAQSVRYAQQLMSIVMLGSALLAALLAARLLLQGAQAQTGDAFLLVMALLAALDVGLLLVLMIHPQRSAWLIY